MKTYNRLRARLKAFVRAYVETGVGVQAMKAIGFTGTRPAIAASKLLAKPNIRLAVQELELTMQEQVRQRIYAAIHRVELISRFDPRQLVNSETGRPLDLHLLSEEVAAAIQGVEIEETINKDGQFVRRFKYRAAPKLDADKVILQYQRVLVEKHEHTGPGGGPIQTVNATLETTDPIEAMRAYQEMVSGAK